MIVSENLRKLRHKHSNFSQKEMAEFLNVQQSTYSNWESGASDIKSEHIIKIAEIFGVEISQLFTQKSGFKIVNKSKNKEKDSGHGLVIKLSNKEVADGLLEKLEELIKKLNQ